ncbi:hypothetical protein [Pseudomonas sp. AB6]|uniref:hypothetical protein n=1 Tax=Pseudomonas sp. AB6 TaxID=3048598 RepID=UPI002AB4FD4F|nr:hypothetical protein [Pseudomonas sp. AB6]MDY7563398.1 hypothetical protein [Pseudomonas sp. AB6]MEB0213419.1 hypothetical protein [Pseudomonas sp. AB6]
MSAVLSFKRCVGESPPIYGSRKAYCFVRPDYSGACCLHYEVESQAFMVGFASYQQALTAATMAIFSQKANFQNVRITASKQDIALKLYGSAKAWIHEIA